MKTRKRPVELHDSPEHRAIPLDRIEFRADDEDDNALYLEGYASTFEPYEMYGGPAQGGWIEQLDKRAFDKTLREKPDLHLLINHAGMPLARTKSGNLELSTDERGLKVRAKLDKRDPEVQSLAIKMERGDMDEMSFAFRVKAQSWAATDEFPDDNQALRTINEVSLHKGDVSVVNWGANPTTHAEVLSAPELLRAFVECEDFAEVRSDDKLVNSVLEKLGANKGPIVNIENLSADQVDEHFRASAQRAGEALAKVQKAESDKREECAAESDTGNTICVSIRFDGFDKPSIYHVLSDSLRSETGEYNIVLTKSDVVFRAGLFAEAEAHYRKVDPDAMKRIDVINAEVARRQAENPDGITKYPTDAEIDELLRAEEAPKGMSLNLALALQEL